MSGAAAASMEPAATAESAAPGGPPPTRLSRLEAVLLRPIFRTAGLRGQLLGGLAVLIVVALLATVSVLLVWLPTASSGGPLALGLAGLVIADTAIVLLFGDYLMRKNFLDPVDRMVEGAEAIADGDPTRRLDEAGSEEMRRLGESLNRMAERLLRNQRLLTENVQSLNETNRALTEARNELIQSEKLASVGRLAAGVAHEIGNPLGAILGYLEVAERRAQGDPEWLGEVRREAERVDRIVRGLLDFARPRSATARTMDPNGLARRCVELLETQGRFAGLAIHLELSEEARPVRGDPGQLEQVLVNLLLNAADAVEAADGAGTIRVRTAPGRWEAPTGPAQPARRKDDPEGVDYSHLRRFRRAPQALKVPAIPAGAPVVRIEVLDDGSGLAQEDAPRVFEPFFTTKDPGRGTGLGLAVSARLVEGMGGMISAEPLPEGGARFRVVLPVAEGG